MPAPCSLVADSSALAAQRFAGHLAHDRGRVAQGGAERLARERRGEPSEGVGGAGPHRRVGVLERADERRQRARLSQPAQHDRRVDPHLVRGVVSERLLDVVDAGPRLVGPGVRRGGQSRRHGRRRGRGRAENAREAALQELPRRVRRAQG
jgi:hypothetical protein